MKTPNSERNILTIIRFGAVVLILIFSIIITYSMIRESNSKLEKEIETFRNDFLTKNKADVKYEVERTIASINYEINKSEEALKKILKEKVYEAHHIATNIYNTQSDLSKNEDISKMIKNALEGMIYNGGNGYIFIDDINGVKILQPLNKDIEGQNLSEYADTKGYKYMKKITDTIKNKTESYDEYYWYKSKDDKTAYKKISFYKYFEPLNYAIGTGEYFLDFEKKIQDSLLDKIKETKFNDNSYIFIFNKNGEYLSHFDKNKIGTNGFNLKDKNGKYFIKDMFEFVKENNEGYIKYIASLKPNHKITNEEKISYVKYFDKWDWIIGSGFYLSELNDVIKKKEIELINNHKNIINNIMVLSVLLTIILLIISFYISKRIEEMFNKYKEELQKEINNTIEKERLLIQQSKMATMGEMIGNIAHQWKQPLSTISTVSTGIKLQKEMNCLKDRDIVPGMNNINNSVQYLSQTIDDFRNFFKPNKKRINFKVLNVFEDTIKLTNPQFKNNNIEFIKNIDANEIYGYYNELLQVLINIFKNSKDEFIKLDKNKKRFIFIDAYKENSNYIIKIRDNAGGVSSDIMGKIFKPYFTTKEEKQGTGIGLYMCRQIIEGMNGKIEVINTEYEYEGEKYIGAEFIIKLFIA